MGLLDALKRKIKQLMAAPQTIQQRVAPKAQAMLRESSRTARGNVPWFAGPLKGSTDIPTTVTAEGADLKVKMVDWAWEREQDKGAAEKLAALVRAEIRATGGR